MQGGEPQLAAPTQPALRAGPPQFAAVVRPAVPEAAAPGAGEGVFRAHEQQSAAGLQNAREFAQAGPRVGEVFEHPTADDRVERGIRIRQAGEVGGGVPHAVAVEPPAGAGEHLLRQVERGDAGVRVGVLEEEERIATVATRGVEDRLAAADVERAGPD